MTDLPGVPQPPISPFSIAGAPSVANYSGFLLEPEKDSSLQGSEKYLTYSDMVANATIVGAGVRLYLSLVSKADWTAQPADDSEQAKELATYVETMLHDMEQPWSTIVQWAAMYKFYGFAILEWTMKLGPDGRITFRAVDSRPQSTITRWDQDSHGAVLGCVQTSPQDFKEIYLPREKLVHLVDNGLKDSPEGMGLFRHIAKANRRLERYELLEAWGYEADLRGIPIGRGPLMELALAVKAGKLDPTQAEAILQPLKDFIRKHNKSPALGMMIDSAPYRADGEQRTPSAVPQWAVELLKGDGGPQQEVAAAIERTTREIARVLGVEHLLLGSNDRGSFAMASAKTQSFGEIIDSALKGLREAFTRDLLRPLWALNGWDPALMPKFITSQAQYRALEELTGALKDMATAGAVILPGDPVVNQVRALAGLDPVPQELVDKAVLAADTAQEAAEASVDALLNPPEPAAPVAAD